MKEITLLSQDTIDKIAAGEVVERPSSVVKELVENAVDAGANAVTVEIRDGGTSLIRITDNGSGIPKDQVALAYMRHATSKIRNVEDLLTSGTLGFRGEALSSIAAVSQVEMITKTAGSLTGVRYVIEGGVEKELEEIGAPEGTTFLVHNLFYNTPVRKKFLKSAASEAGYVNELMERLALSHSNIAFKFINNKETKLHTSGNNNLKDIIYSIYGREITQNLVKVDADYGNIKISGFIGKPVISRGNRNYENYFVNDRYVKSKIVAKAIEDGYKAFMMNHRYPFTVLMIRIDTDEVDVNVHPQKLEVRFANQQKIYDRVNQTIKEALLGKELIPEFTIDAPKTTGQTQRTGSGIPAQQNTASGPAQSPFGNPKSSEDGKETAQPQRILKSFSGAQHNPDRQIRYPEPFETVRSRILAEADSPYGETYPDRSRRSLAMKMVTGSVPPARGGSEPNQSGTLVSGNTEAVQDSVRKDPAKDDADRDFGKMDSVQHVQEKNGMSRPVSEAVQKAEQAVQEDVRRMRAEKENREAVQMELFQNKLLDASSRPDHKLIGQVFDTYWIVEFDDKMYIIDQHAAHEKVMYEQFMKQYREKKQTSQMITPPMIVTLNLQEEELLHRHEHAFRSIGFEISPFGGREYSISAVPGNLYGLESRELFLEILDGLTGVAEQTSEQLICEKIASMSCKAAVKGNNRMSFAEADALISELLTLENPYNCPHGRPTIVSMTKYEMEKKFKRVL